MKLSLGEFFTISILSAVVGGVAGYLLSLWINCPCARP